MSDTENARGFVEFWPTLEGHYSELRHLLGPVAKQANLPASKLDGSNVREMLVTMQFAGWCLSDAETGHKLSLYWAAADWVNAVKVAMSYHRDLDRQRREVASEAVRRLATSMGKARRLQ